MLVPEDFVPDHYRFSRKVCVLQQARDGRLFMALDDAHLCRCEIKMCSAVYIYVY